MHVYRRWASSVFCLALLTQAAAARAAITTVSIAALPGPPVAITNAHDGSGRLFITLQDGRVMIHDGCVLLATPFLNISSLVTFGGEQGLLSIAFHPSFPATPYFYVNYTRAGDGATVIARYKLSTGNPNLADPASGVTLLVIAQPFANHNGGQLQFGPDGYLYIGMGDGGSGGDPQCNGQRDDTLLGKMLRLDVNQSFNAPPFYGIPAGNPYPGPIPAAEIWARGLRNPFRFSFDRTTGDLFIGDVGQDTREEVDFQAAGLPGGRNYGWNVMEGFTCFSSACSGAPACNSPSLTLPIFDYDHGNPESRCAVIGGYRYRGTQVTGLAGTYVYGDLCSGDIFGATLSGTWTSTSLLSSGFSISTFGEDEAGELYVANLNNNNVYRIVNPNRQANLSITKTDGQTLAIPGQPLTYTIAVGNAGPAAASSVIVNDPFPASLQNVNWTCSASAGSSCCSIVGGNVTINRPVYVLPGGTVTYTATATLSAAASGTLSNTASVTAPSGVTDPNLANNSATDVDTVPVLTDLAITKTDGQATATPNQAVAYTITASNASGAAQHDATGATVTDTVPASLTGVTWTCVGTGGTCGAASGSGNIADTVNLPVGSSVTYTLNATVIATPTNLRNTATVAVPPTMGDPNLANNTAVDDDTLICNGETVVVADGRLTSGTIGAGATVRFGSHLKIGDSYSWEFKSLIDSGTPPGTATFFSGDDGCSPTSTLTPRDTTNIDPGAATTTRRVSFVATGTEPFFRAQLVNSGAAIPYSFSVTDTTLYSPAWSTNGSFNTFYSFQNTTSATVTGTLTLLDTAGVVLSTFPVSVPAGQTTSTNTLALNVVRGRIGTARFAHDGPPGAVVAEAAIANFSISPSYVQPVKFQATRDAR